MSIVLIKIKLSKLGRWLKPLRTINYPMDYLFEPGRR